jgi:hypothetical protein
VHEYAPCYKKKNVPNPTGIITFTTKQNVDTGMSSQHQQTPLRWSHHKVWIKLILFKVSSWTGREQMLVAYSKVSDFLVFPVTVSFIPPLWCVPKFDFAISKANSSVLKHTLLGSKAMDLSHLIEHIFDVH